jgi:hypothetical protein
MMRKAPEIIDVNAQQFEEILERAASNTLRDEDTQLLRHLFASYAGLFQIVGDKNTTIARLRKMMFGATSEKSENVLGDAEDALNPSPGDASDEATADSRSSQDVDSSKPASGHGRLGADAYPGADQVEVTHPQHAAGDVCPDCGQGPLYGKRTVKCILQGALC